MKNKKSIVITVAALVAVVGSVVLVLFVRGAEDRALAGEELVTALVTTQQIPAGTAAEELADFVETEQVPVKIAPEGVVTDLSQMAGQVTAADILAGEAVLAGRFVAADEFSARPTSVDIPEGFLEVTIAVSQEQFIGGIPVPGNKVAILASGTRDQFIAAGDDPLNQPGATVDPATLRYSRIVLQQALVTNVQGNPLPDGSEAQAATDRVAPADGSVLVTLALDGPDTTRLVFVRNDQSLNASLHVALHHDGEAVEDPGISVDDLFEDAG